MRLHLLVLAIVFCCGACRKEQHHTYTQQDLTLERTIGGTSVTFSWQTIATEDFISYELYGGDSLLPNPDTAGQIAATLIFKTSDFSETHFTDPSAQSLIHNYYRLYCRIGNRILSSQNIRNNQTEFVPIKNYNAEPGSILQIPGETKFIALSREGIVTSGTIYDYDKKEFVVKNKALTGYSPHWFQLGIYENKSALFTIHRQNNMGPWTLYIYDCQDLTLMRSQPIATSDYIEPMFLKNDYFVTKSQYSNPVHIVSYHLQTQQVDTIQTDYSPAIIHRAINPSFFTLKPYQADTLLIFNIETNGRVAQPAVIHTPLNSLFDWPHAVTNGSLEHFINFSSLTFFDRNFKVQRVLSPSSTAFQTFSYAGSSFDSEFTVFLANTSTTPGEIIIYKKGEAKPYKQLKLGGAFNNLLIDNHHLTIAQFDFQQNQRGLQLMKIEL